MAYRSFPQKSTLSTVQTHRSCLPPLSQMRCAVLTEKDRPGCVLLTPQPPRGHRRLLGRSAGTATRSALMHKPICTSALHLGLCHSRARRALTTLLTPQFPYFIIRGLAHLPHLLLISLATDRGRLWLTLCTHEPTRSQPHYLRRCKSSPHPLDHGPTAYGHTNTAVSQSTAHTTGGIERSDQTVQLGHFAQLLGSQLRNVSKQQDVCLQSSSDTPSCTSAPLSPEVCPRRDARIHATGSTEQEL